MRQCRISWEGEFAGSGTDTFSLDGTMTMLQHTNMVMKSGRTLQYKTVFHRVR